MSVSADPQDTDEPSRYTLPADLGIEHVAALRQALDAHLEAPQLLLDASAPSRLHAASLQLLAAFCRTRRAAGRGTRWQDASHPFADAVRALGLQTHLQFEGVAA